MSSALAGGGQPLPPNPPSASAMEEPFSNVISASVKGGTFAPPPVLDFSNAMESAAKQQKQLMGWVVEQITDLNQRMHRLETAPPTASTAFPPYSAPRSAATVETDHASLDVPPQAGDTVAPVSLQVPSDEKDASASNDPKADSAPNDPAAGSQEEPQTPLFPTAQPPVVKGVSEGMPTLDTEATERVIAQRLAAVSAEIDGKLNRLTNWAKTQIQQTSQSINPAIENALGGPQVRSLVELVVDAKAVDFRPSAEELNQRIQELMTQQARPMARNRKTVQKDDGPQSPKPQSPKKKAESQSPKIGQDDDPVSPGVVANESPKEITPDDGSAEAAAQNETSAEPQSPSADDQKPSAEASAEIVQAVDEEGILKEKPEDQKPQRSSSKSSTGRVSAAGGGVTEEDLEEIRCYMDNLDQKIEGRVLRSELMDRDAQIAPLKKETDALRNEIVALQGSLAEMKYDLSMQGPNYNNEPDPTVTASGISSAYGIVQDRSQIAIDVKMEELTTQVQELKKELEETNEKVTNVQDTLEEEMPKVETAQSTFEALEERVRNLDEDYRKTETYIGMKMQKEKDAEKKMQERPEPIEEKTEEEEAALILNIVRQEVDKTISEKLDVLRSAARGRSGDSENSLSPKKHRASRHSKREPSADPADPDGTGSKSQPPDGSAEPMSPQLPERPESPRGEKKERSRRRRRRDDDEQEEEGVDIFAEIDMRLQSMQEQITQNTMNYLVLKGRAARVEKKNKTIDESLVNRKKDLDTLQDYLAKVGSHLEVMKGDVQVVRRQSRTRGSIANFGEDDLGSGGTDASSKRQSKVEGGPQPKRQMSILSRELDLDAALGAAAAGPQLSIGAVSAAKNVARSSRKNSGLSVPNAGMQRRGSQQVDASSAARTTALLGGTPSTATPDPSDRAPSALSELSAPTSNTGGGGGPTVSQFSRLVKKVSEIEGNIKKSEEGTNEELICLTTRLAIICQFLPPKYRKMVETTVKDEHRKPLDLGDGKFVINFGEEPPKEKKVELKVPSDSDAKDSSNAGEDANKESSAPITSSWAAVAAINSASEAAQAEKDARSAARVETATEQQTEEGTEKKGNTLDPGAASLSHDKKRGISFSAKPPEVREFEKDHPQALELARIRQSQSQEPRQSNQEDDSPSWYAPGSNMPSSRQQAPLRSSSWSNSNFDSGTSDRILRKLDIMEDEQKEMERELRGLIEALTEEMKEKFEMGVKKGPAGHNTQAMGMGQYDTLYKLKVKMDKAIEPQVQAHEERLEKLLNEVKETSAGLRRMQDAIAKKSDRTELEPVMMRIAVWENIKPQTLEAGIQRVEAETSQNKLFSEHVANQVQAIQTAMATKEELDKMKTEILGVKKDCTTLRAEQKEDKTQLYLTNRAIKQQGDDLQSKIDTMGQKLQQEKASIDDLSEVSAKIQKLESSSRDNRQLLDGAGGSEVSDVVKRIILNMEDKIMLIDRKVETLVQSGPPNSGPGLSPKVNQESTATLPSQPTTGVGLSKDASLVSINSDISQMMEKVVLLDKKIQETSTEVDRYRDEDKAHWDLVEQLQTSVAADSGATAMTEATVQVMIAGAVRKVATAERWVTRHYLDQRSVDLKREFNTSFGQLRKELHNVSKFADLAQNLEQRLDRLSANRQSLTSSQNLSSTTKSMPLPGLSHDKTGGAGHNAQKIVGKSVVGNAGAAGLMGAIVGTELPEVRAELGPLSPPKSARSTTNSRPNSMSAGRGDDSGQRAALNSVRKNYM